MADSFLAAMTPLGVREECIHKAHHLVSLGAGGASVSGFLVFFGKMMFSAPERRKRSRFMPSRDLSEITCPPFLTGENLGINHPTPMTKPSPKRASVN